MIGEYYLTIILLWCGQPVLGNAMLVSPVDVRACRKEKIQCVRKLKNFTTDEVVDRCLLGGGK